MKDAKQTRAPAEEPYKTRLDESAGARFHRPATLGTQS